MFILNYQQIKKYLNGKLNYVIRKIIIAKKGKKFGKIQYSTKLKYQKKFNIDRDMDAEIIL